LLAEYFSFVFLFPQRMVRNSINFGNTFRTNVLVSLLNVSGYGYYNADVLVRLSKTMALAHQGILSLGFSFLF